MMNEIMGDNAKHHDDHIQEVGVQHVLFDLSLKIATARAFCGLVLEWLQPGCFTSASEGMQ